MKNIPLTDLTLQTAEIQSDVERRFKELFKTGTFILRQPLLEFESKFCEFLGVRHGVGVGSGTDALTIALKALELQPGDEVITAVNSFIATAEAIVLSGLTPVFVDIDKASFNINCEQVKRAITERTKVVIPVHLYGRAAEMDELLAIARRHNLIVVEDAAQAHGAYCSRQRVGSLGDMACFSFYPTKNIGAFGDGGIVVTNDDKLAERARMLRDHGGLAADQHEFVGHNSRLDSLQASVLTVKLPRLDGWNEMRKKHAAVYADALEQRKLNGIVIPPVVSQEDHVFHLYVTRIVDGRRDYFLQELRERGIGASVTYPTPIHLTKAFAFLDKKKGSFPIAEELSNQILTLPMYPELTTEQVLRVCDTLKAIC